MSNSIYISSKFDYVGDPSQMRRGLAERTLSVATGDYVAGKSAGYEHLSVLKQQYRELK